MVLEEQQQRLPLVFKFMYIHTYTDSNTTAATTEKEYYWEVHFKFIVIPTSVLFSQSGLYKCMGFMEYLTLP